MKQRYIVGKMTFPDEKEGGSDEVTMETLGRCSSEGSDRSMSVCLQMGLLTCGCLFLLS